MGEAVATKISSNKQMICELHKVLRSLHTMHIQYDKNSLSALCGYI